MKLIHWIALQFPAYTFDQLFDPKTGPVRLLDDGAGNVTIGFWDAATLGEAPSAAQLASISSLPEAQPPQVLIPYVEAAYEKSLGVAVQVNVNPGGSPLMILVDAAPATQNALNSLALWGTLNPSGTRVWTDNNEVSTSLTGAQLVALATAVFNRVESAFSLRTTTIAQVKSATITLTSQIDAITWPTS